MSTGGSDADQPARPRPTSATRPAKSVWAALLALLWAPAWGAEVAVRSVHPESAAVPLYGTCEIDLDVRGNWENPFDPGQIDVAAHVTSPSGGNLTIPAFFCQPYQHRIVPPAEQRQRVVLLKFYINEDEWSPGADIQFFIDDVRIVSSASGEARRIDDIEGDNPYRVEQTGVVEASAEMARSGNRALRFAPKIEGEESWPGAVWRLPSADWSAHDRLTMEVYPKVNGLRGPVHLYFRDEKFGNSPIRRWDLSAGSLMPDAWNHLEWDWRGFERTLAFEKDGEPTWKVRFTPTEMGAHRLTVTARDRNGETRSEPRKIEVTPSALPGFVRASDKSPHYFELDSGEPFFAIGHDVPSEIGEALEFFPKMQSAGENCTYVIMYPDKLAIEWEELGKYDQRAAAALDWYIDWARKHGIYVKLSFDEHCVNRPSRMWGTNPYNAANGGPCRGVNEFYTSPEAARRYRNRLRYIVARWAHSTHLMAWEYFAEIDGATALGDSEGWGYPTREGGGEVSAMLVRWIGEMSAFIREHDPYDHLITESFGSGTSDPQIWSMPEIDYTQIHQYNVADTAGSLGDWCLNLVADYAKPMLVTEFGWSTKLVGSSVDPQGICLHNGIWATMASGSAGTAMTWWRQRVDRLDLYAHFRALANFAQGIDWTAEAFQPIRASATLPVPDHHVDVTVPSAGPFSGATVATFVIGRDGGVNDPGQVPHFLLARGRSEPRTVPEFVVDYPQGGKFIVHVDSVSPDALLELHVDGEPALRKPLPAENVPGKACLFDRRWDVWRCTYDEDFEVDVPPGKHTIRIENAEENASWIAIESYRLTDYAPPALRVLGLSGRSMSLLWVQNKENTWWNDKQGRRARPIIGAIVDVAVPADGAYAFEWWDTYTGTVLRQETRRSEGQTLSVPLPPIERDIACKIRAVE